MCTGAEPAAAGAAKGAADVSTALAAEEALTGASMTALATGAEALPAAIAASDAVYAGATAAGAAAGGGKGGAAATSPTMSNLAAGASVANAGLGLLSAMKGSKTPPAPSLLAPIVMPTTDDLATQRARKAMLATLSQRRGRTSTILSNDTLGGN